MKNKFILIAALQVMCITAGAQLYVQSGATLATTGKAVVTLQDVSLQNNGTISQAATGKFVFNGAGNNLISGSSTTVFDTLEIAKTITGKIFLSQNAGISGAVLFSSGLIDLNNKNIALQPGAVLKNETEATRITGLSGGNVIVNAGAVNNPALYNPGNLGAALTSTQNLGSLQISRSHKPATNPANAATGIQRTYIITPQNNTALNATLRFFYLDAELNGKNENTLMLWRSEDGIHWNLAGFDNRNTAANYVEKNSIVSFSTWTLTDAIMVLPVTLVSYAAICNNNIVTIKWSAAGEEPGDRFEIEKSTNAGAVFATAGTQASAGNGSNSYSFMDTDPAPAGSRIVYRIKLISHNGNYSYSPVFSGSCSDVTMPFTIYPNPAQEATAIHLAVRQNTKAELTLYNAAGQRIMKLPYSLCTGSNTIPLSTGKLPAGNYFVQMLLEGGTILKGSFVKGD